MAHRHLAQLLNMWQSVYIFGTTVITKNCMHKYIKAYYIWGIFNDIRTKLQRLHYETAKVGLKINISKTKEIHIHTPNNQPLLLNDKQIEQVSEFPCLGSIISKDNGGMGRDVAERIKKARGTFRTINTV